MSSPSQPAHLSNHQRNTLRQIFQHPAGHNIEWHAVRSLLEAVGSAEEQHGGKVAVTIVSALSSPVSKTGIRASYTRTLREEFPVLRPRFPAAFRPPGICFPGHPVLPGSSAPLTVGLPHRLRLPAPGMRTHRGFPRSARVRPGPGRAPSLPRERRCPLAIELPVAAACRLSAAGSCHPGTATQPGMSMSRGIRRVIRNSPAQAFADLHLIVSNVLISARRA